MTGDIASIVRLDSQCGLVALQALGSRLNRGIHTITLRLHVAQSRFARSSCRLTLHPCRTTERSCTTFDKASLTFVPQRKLVFASQIVTLNCEMSIAD